MRPSERLKQQLFRLDGKDYGAYQSLTGGWSFPDYDLLIDRIPKDPYAPPSTGVYRIRVSRKDSIFPGWMTETRIREVALRDFLARQVFNQSTNICRGRRGTGNSGIITISEAGQAILERTSVIITESFIEARICLGMPAAGRKVKSKVALSMLFEELPEIINKSLFYDNLNREALERHIKAAEDAESLRAKLYELGLVAFIADGAILPRKSGVDQSPLLESSVVRFKSPESLKVSVDLPNSGTVSGMGIREGVTLIVGGGFHGKSTLLETIELGIYNHIPGDGRELCVTIPEAVKVRAASGRSVVRTDISAFINNIPLREDSSTFTSANASGSTSQAAFISESLEAGAKALLMDEDTCAMNFMIRDKRMQELVAKKDEPITSFVDKVRQLYKEFGVSTILVMGGSGDYFSVADCIIQMVAFKPCDVTSETGEIMKQFPTDREQEGDATLKNPKKRIPLDKGLEPRNEYGHLRVNAPDPKKLIFGAMKVDLLELEQLVEMTQTKAIGRAILHAKQYMDGEKTLSVIIKMVMDVIDREGLDILDDRLTGDLAEFRGLEFAAVLNRMRGLVVK